MRHGTNTGYTGGCRCEFCRAAHTTYNRLHESQYKRPLRGENHREAMRDLLLELCPCGLTTDSPLGRARAHREELSA